MQYEGKDIAGEIKIVTKPVSAEDEIQAVSGATVSTRAVNSAVQASADLGMKLFAAEWRRWKMKLFKIFKSGIIDENPTFRLVLGTCPTLAITTSAVNGIGMGLATTAVLIGSNVVISLLRKFIPNKVRIPAFVTVIAGFVTIVQMLLKAYVPSLDKALGIYIPLIVVNCIIMARAESFASKNPVLDSAIDGLGMGIGFTLAITVIGAIKGDTREWQHIQCAVAGRISKPCTGNDPSAGWLPGIWSCHWSGQSFDQQTGTGSRLWYS